MKAQPRNATVKGLPRPLLCALMGVVLLSTGCASKYGAQMTTVNHYPDCYAPISELRQSEYRAEKSAAGGAVAGAALGALIGYLATGKGSGAAVGAATGAVAGGAAGGIYGSQAQKSEDAARLAEYNSQLDGNIREANKATAAAKVARQCYERQFKVAAAEFKAKRLTKDQFNSRYIEVTNGMEEAASILGQVNRNNSEIAAEYNRALQQERARASSSGKKTAQAAPSAEQRRQLSQMQNKNTVMQRSVKESQEEEKLLLQRLSATHQQAKDLMS